MTKDLKNIIVIGGSGGIGSALVDALLQRFPTAAICATYHQSIPRQEHGRLQWQQLNVRDVTAIEIFSERFECVDWLINCVGILHKDGKGPEKNIRSVEADFLMESIAVNTLPTLMLAKHFSEALRRSPFPLLATVSARVGSIEDNRLGGWYSYRLSKAALNMALKTLSIEWNHSHRKGCVVALHPGTNNTRLSKPFQANVVPQDLLMPSYTALKFLELFEQLGPEQSGKFWTWEGDTLPW